MQHVFHLQLHSNIRCCYLGPPCVQLHIHLVPCRHKLPYQSTHPFCNCVTVHHVDHPLCVYVPHQASQALPFALGHISPALMAPTTTPGKHQDTTTSSSSPGLGATGSAQGSADAWAASMSSGCRGLIVYANQGLGEVRMVEFVVGAPPYDIKVRWRGVMGARICV